MEDLSKSASVRGNNARATIGARFKRELMSFMRLITERSENNDPRARDISSYTASDIIEH